MKHEIHAPRGTTLSCKNWLIEAPYRMLQNNLDPQVELVPAEFQAPGERAAQIARPSNPLTVGS